jgi:hypothetical protein
MWSRSFLQRRRPLTSPADQVAAVDHVSAGRRVLMSVSRPGDGAASTRAAPERSNLRGSGCLHRLRWVRVTWRERWAAQPLWARCVLVAYALGFTDGTGVHVRDLVRGGLHAYSSAPAAVQVFFVGLVLLDPLVVVLILRVCPAGIWLAGAVMAVDLATNWFINRKGPLFLRQAVGLLPITLFGLFVLVSMVPLRRSLSAAGSTAA